jgi:hypothetical protein
VTLDAPSDTLTVEVTYPGGCKTHEMTLCWSGWSSVAAPTELYGFFVDHWNDGDSCTGLVTETLHFDLSDIRYDYDVDGGGFGDDDVVWLVFADGKKLEYDFRK